MGKHNKIPNEKGENYLISYINDVLIPASNEFSNHLSKNKVRLHHVYSFNAILAHAIDYMVFIAKKNNNKASRKAFIKEFDDRYAVDGCEHINNKFTLLDAINNSFKHVELNKIWYKELIKKYGELSFHSLKYENGKVFFVMPDYKFDYSRVVLRPIAAIFNCDLKTTDDIDDFINGRIYGSSGYGHFNYDYEPHDAIDRMVDACNPVCMDCGEGYDKCDCPNFIYHGNRGEFSGNLGPNFDFADVMSNISGTREWSK
ncbi:hypothetical protein [Shewanella baltica]|uniref:hypothetical protein n=1 Tax=Shewanella baltica TaxID=62322 RepID=UPI00217D9BEA|nr:hypothetical protein [Shewanella baltica]MCS6191998.1 hypothetical protein [Shewanella baltica]